MKRIVILAIGIFVAFTPMIIYGVNASPVYYSGTGHYYEAISAPGITWMGASSAAQSSSYSGVNGHLATITSQGEQDFIATQLGNVDGYWLGGIQPAGSPEPAGGWQWVTGEPWGYTNWYGGEANNHYGGDQGIHPYGFPENALQITWWPTGGMWNDFPDDIPMYGYVVEYDTGNQPPVANAGPDQYVNVKTIVTLDGSGSTGSSISYQWTPIWPTGSNAQLLNPTTVAPTFTPDIVGDYVFQLVVTDSQGTPSQPDSVIIHVYCGGINTKTVEINWGGAIEKGKCLKDVFKTVSGEKIEFCNVGTVGDEYIMVYSGPRCGDSQVIGVCDWITAENIKTVTYVTDKNQKICILGTEFRNKDYGADDPQCGFAPDGLLDWHVYTYDVNSCVGTKTEQHYQYRCGCYPPEACIIFNTDTFNNWLKEPQNKGRKDVKILKAKYVCNPPEGNPIGIEKLLSWPYGKC